MDSIFEVDGTYGDYNTAGRPGRSYFYGDFYLYWYCDAPGNSFPAPQPSSKDIAWSGKAYPYIDPVTGLPSGFIPPE